MANTQTVSRLEGQNASGVSVQGGAVVLKPALTPNEDHRLSLRVKLFATLLCVAAEPAPAASAGFSSVFIYLRARSSNARRRLRTVRRLHRDTLHSEREDDRS